jgi:olefin beta-lactone synthetase
MTSESPLCNIAARLRTMAGRVPAKEAVVFPEGRDAEGSVIYTHLTFAELDRASDGYARGFERIGIGRGVKTLLMVKPSLEFISLTFALFKVGAVPVLIDPGMGRKRLLHCIAEVQPEALIGIPLAHVARLLFARSFRSLKCVVTVGRRWFWGGHSLRNLKDPAEEPFEMASTRAGELAAILFTTGSTGPAKGVEYEHGMFDAQCDLIRETFGMTEDDIDLPTFPLFSLFSVALGMTAVIPDMDPTKPAEVDPAKIVEAIHNRGCTFSFGSPALWGRVTSYCVEHSIKLPTLRTVLMAGAPVPAEVHERFRAILPEGAETNTPYGATEALPSTNITGSEVLAETASATAEGKGVCVGRPVFGVTAEIIRMTDDVLEEWSDDLILPQGEIGEIAVKGPTVTRRYYRKEEATRAHKIHDGDEIRHRIGDVGYRDERGRIWFCGRKGHRVETEEGIMYSVCCEAIFNRHGAVKRSALVGVGQRPEQRPVIVIELNDRSRKKAALTTELLELGAENLLTTGIRDVLYHPSFPVDIRHNAKICREELAVWAADRLGERR